MVAQQEKPVDNAYAEIRDLAERVRMLEEYVKNDPSLDEIRAILTDLAGKQLPAVNKAIDDLRKDGRTLSNKVAQLEKLPPELNKTNTKVNTLETKLQKLDTQHEKPAEIAKKKLTAYKGYSSAAMKNAVEKERPEVLVEVAKLLSVKNPADEKVLKLMVKHVPDDAGQLTAELVTLAGN